MSLFSRFLSPVTLYRKLLRELWAARKEINLLFRFEKLLHDITTRFINLNIENYDAVINDLLEDIGRFAGVDRAYLFLVNQGGKTISNTHEWRKSSHILPVNEQLKHFPINTYTWWRQYLPQDYVHHSSIDELPEEAQAERRFMTLGGIQSLLFVPLMRRGNFEGFIGFDSVSTHKKWSKKEIYLLQSVALDIVNLRLRWEAEKDSRRSRSIFAELVTSIESVFFLFSEDLSQTIYVSPVYSAVWEKSVESLQENPLSWLDSVVSDERKEVEDAFYSFVRSGEPFSAEFRIKTARSVKWITLRAFRSETDEAVHIAAVAEDISTRRTAELQLASIREEDLETSARIQKSILIVDPEISNPSVDVAALSIPSQEVDGDFYNAMMVGEDVFDLLVGDVMGKGIPGAFIAAAVRNHFLQVKLDMMVKSGGSKLPAPGEIVAEVARRVNDELIYLESFVTLSYSRFNIKMRRFDFVDCGHTPLIHFHNDTGKCWFVKGRCLPLGFSKDETYVQQSIPFGENDILFFYSDGISGARNSEGELFGEKRLVSLIEQKHTGSAKGLIDAMKEEISAFSGGAALADDFTCVAIKLSRLPGKISSRHGVFPHDMEALPLMRSFIETCLDEAADCRLAHPEKLKVILSGTEAASNIIKYGIDPEKRTSGFYLEVGVSPEWVYLRYIYAGNPFVFHGPEGKPAIEKLQEHGYGFFIIEELMDSMIYANDNRGGVMMTLVKYIDEEKKS